MEEWLTKNGWTHTGSHEEGRLFANQFLFISLLNGDGYWQIYRRDSSNDFLWKDALATGAGIGQLQAALLKLGTGLVPRTRPARSLCS
jgi:hypothetical protein